MHKRESADCRSAKRAGRRVVPADPMKAAGEQY